MDRQPAQPTPLPDSDLDLIDRARDAGDSPAIEELYRRHSDAALRLARHLSDPVTAEDIVAEAFARVLQALRVGKGPTSAFRPYFLTAVRNAYVTHVRQDSRHVWTADHPEAGLEVPVADATTQRADSQLLADAFSSLPTRWQVVLWHTAVEGDDHETVGRLLGIKANAVAALGFRAREGLRKAYLAAHLAATPSDECRPIIEQLPVYLRGGLGRRQRTQVEEHLDTCRECSAAYLEVGAINSGLGALLAPAVLGSAGAAYAVPAVPVTTGGSTGSGDASLLVRLVRRPAGTAAAVTVLVTLIVSAALAVQPLMGEEDAGGRGDVSEAPLVTEPSAVDPTPDPSLAPPSPSTSPTATLSPSQSAPSASASASASSSPSSNPSPGLPTPSLSLSLPPLPTTPTEVPTSVPTDPPTTEVPMTTEDLALTSVSHTFYGPHHHLQMHVDARLDPTTLTFVIAGLSSFTVHQDLDFVGTECAATSAEPAVVTCLLAAGSGTFAIDVVVNGPLDATVRVSGDNNADPDPTNDVAVFG